MAALQARCRYQASKSHATALLKKCVCVMWMPVCVAVSLGGEEAAEGWSFLVTALVWVPAAILLKPAALFTPVPLSSPSITPPSTVRVAKVAALLALNPGVLPFSTMLSRVSPPLKVPMRRRLCV